MLIYQRVLEEVLDRVSSRKYLSEVGKISISQQVPEPISNGVLQNTVSLYDTNSFSYDNSINNSYDLTSAYTSNTASNILTIEFISSILPFTPYKAYTTSANANSTFDTISSPISSGIHFSNNDTVTVVTSDGLYSEFYKNNVYTAATLYEARYNSFNSFSVDSFGTDEYLSQTVGTSGHFDFQINHEQNAVADRFIAYILSKLLIVANVYPYLYFTNTEYESNRFNTDVISEILTDVTVNPYVRPLQNMYESNRFTTINYYPIMLLRPHFESLKITKAPVNLTRFSISIRHLHISTISKLPIVINSIRYLAPNRILSSIQKINYLTVNRFTAIDNIPILFLYNEFAFYGFFDSSQDAADAAVASKNTPFMVYQVPGSSKYTYRRIFELDRNCTIFPSGARERLIQGG